MPTLQDKKTEVTATQSTDHFFPPSAADFTPYNWQILLKEKLDRFGHNMINLVNCSQGEEKSIKKKNSSD